MSKAFTDVMYLGAGGKFLVIAYLLTSILTGVICISYFTWRYIRERAEHYEYLKALKGLSEDEESQKND